jgi:uncharacterized membrane protein
MDKYQWLGILLIVATCILTAFSYPQLPEKIDSHWDAEGKANGQMDKFFALIISPIIMVLFFGLFNFLPQIDPKAKNNANFKIQAHLFLVLFLAFLAYIQLLMLAWNLGYAFAFVSAMAPAFGILFFGLGALLEKSEPNWFIGIRTPWTLSNPKVWSVVHEKTGKGYKVAGIIALGGIIFQTVAIWLILVPVILVSGYAIVLSYFEYNYLVSHQT